MDLAGRHNNGFARLYATALPCAAAVDGERGALVAAAAGELHDPRAGTAEVVPVPTNAEGGALVEAAAGKLHDPRVGPADVVPAPAEAEGGAPAQTDADTTPAATPTEAPAQTTVQTAPQATEAAAQTGAANSDSDATQVNVFLVFMSERF